MKASGAAGVAAAFPCVIPSRVLAGEGRTPPSERITMGFIGLGGQGSGHLAGGAWTYLAGGYLGRSDVQVLAVCDVRRGQREAARARVNGHYSTIFEKGSYKSCDAYVDFRNLLARDDIDAVLIATPNHWHATMTILAAEAGKDVYCEKPTAITIGEGREAAEAVRRFGRVFQAGTQQRSEYDGKFRRACELVRNGRIGTLKEVYSVRGTVPSGWGVCRDGETAPTPDLDWDLFVGPAPWAPTGRIGTFTYGANWEQHHFDIVQWGLGADRTGPVEVSGSECRYANGVVVRFGQFPGRQVGGSGGAWFVGTEGKIGVDRENLVADPPGILHEPLDPDGVRLVKCTSHSGNFLDCVRTRAQPICDAETARRAIGIPLLGGIAARLNRELKWDPDAERFVGDEEANRMLSCARRPLPAIRKEA